MSHPSFIFFPSTSCQITMFLLKISIPSVEYTDPLTVSLALFLMLHNSSLKLYDIFFFKSIMDNSSKSLRYMKGTTFPLHEIINTYNLWYIFVWLVQINPFFTQHIRSLIYEVIYLLYDAQNSNDPVNHNKNPTIKTSNYLLTKKISFLSIKREACML